MNDLNILSGLKVKLSKGFDLLEVIDELLSYIDTSSEEKRFESELLIIRSQVEHSNSHKRIGLIDFKSHSEICIQVSYNLLQIINNILTSKSNKGTVEYETIVITIKNNIENWNEQFKNSITQSLSQYLKIEISQLKIDRILLRGSIKLIVSIPKEKIIEVQNAFKSELSMDFFRKLNIINIETIDEALEASFKSDMTFKSEKNEYLELFDFTNLFLAEKNQNIILQDVCELILKYFNVEVVSLFLIDKKKTHLVCAAASGLSQRLVGLAKHRVGEGLTEHIAKSGQIISVEDASQLYELKILGKWEGNLDFENYSMGIKRIIRNFIGIPIKASNKVYAVLKIENTADNRNFNDLDMKKLEFISNLIAISFLKWE